jgi:phosphatidylglycerophosphatase C
MGTPATSKPEAINVYDFDHTIYRGDSSLHFYFFCILRQPLLLRYFPSQLWHFALFKLKFESRTQFKSNFFGFLRSIDDIVQFVDIFWDKHYSNIKDWYKKSDHARDVIVSASPDFLLYPAFRKLQARMLIATKMDGKSGIISGNNCRGNEKVARLQKELPDAYIEKAYSDHVSDTPILLLAKESYVVKGDKVLTLEEYKKLPLLKALFLRF